ncbi:MAG: hypothetical protein ACOYOL_06780 [Chthoniobacterales bacterium]
MKIRASFLPAGLALLALLMGLAEAPAQFRPPPQGKPLTVEVPRGGTVTIPLTGSDRALRDLQFAIGRSPRWGRLSGLSVESRGRASVRYTHGDDEDSLSDNFVYTVKAGSGGAGRATINIKVVDAAPVLAAPKVVDFGEVVLGETPIRSLQVANLGGGMLEGKIKVPEPFAVETGGSFRLRRGRSADFAISFAPTAPGDFLYRASLSAQDPSVVEFRGRAIEPFAVTAKPSVLAVQPDDSRRTALELVNHAATNNVIRIALPPNSPVEVPREVSLAPGETVPLELLIKPQTRGEVPPFPVVFSTANHTNTLTFSAPPLPARITIVSAPNFGEVKPGFTYEADFSVRNDGGAPAPLRLRPGPTIRSMENTEAFDLASGETKTIKLKLRVKKDQTGPDSLPTDLLIDFNGAQIPVPVHATAAVEVPPVTEAAATPPVIPPSPPAPTPTPKPLGLNAEITLVRTNGTESLEWIERAGWSGYILQRRNETTGAWENYPPPQGIIASLLAWPRQIKHLLTTPIQREEASGFKPTEEPRGGADLLAEADATTVWRMVALPDGGAGHENVSVDFVLSGETLAAAPAFETDTPEVEPGQPDAAEPSDAGPTTEILASVINAGQHGASLLIGVPQNSAVKAYRLERGAMSIPLGLSPGPPREPAFVPIKHASEGTKVLGQAQVKAGDRELDLIRAQIEDLPAGTRTYWRMVPVGDATDARPTGVFVVETKPSPPFPWNTVLLGVLLSLLAGVLYLRWRINHPRE